MSDEQPNSNSPAPVRQAADLLEDLLAECVRQDLPQHRVPRAFAAGLGGGDVLTQRGDALGLKNRAVATPDNSVRSKLPGKPAKPQPMEDGWYFSSDIKAESPLECYLFTSSRDLATLTDVMAEANIEAVAGSHDRVGNRQVFHTEAGAVAGMPYLALEWLYTVERDSQALVGFTKVRAATKGEKAFVCSHNYLGYRDTLARAFATFVENTTVADDGPEPFYEEIARLDMNGMGTGVTYASYRRDDDGGIRMDTAESSLMPVDLPVCLYVRGYDAHPPNHPTTEPPNHPRLTRAWG